MEFPIIPPPNFRPDFDFWPKISLGILLDKSRPNPVREVTFLKFVLEVKDRKRNVNQRFATPVLDLHPPDFFAYFRIFCPNKGLALPFLVRELLSDVNTLGSLILAKTVPSLGPRSLCLL